MKLNKFLSISNLELGDIVIVIFQHLIKHKTTPLKIYLGLHVLQIGDVEMTYFLKFESPNYQCISINFKYCDKVISTV